MSMLMNEAIMRRTAGRSTDLALEIIQGKTVMAEVRRTCVFEYRPLVRRHGLKQASITPHSPEQNGIIERQIWALKKQCLLRQRFEFLQHAPRVLGDWIRFYNHQRPHQAL